METILSHIGLLYIIIRESNGSFTSAISCIIVYFSPKGNKSIEKAMNLSVIGLTLRIAVKKKASSKEMQR